MNTCPNCGDVCARGEYVHVECHDEYIAYLDGETLQDDAPRQERKEERGG